MSSLDDRRVALQGGGHRHLHLQHPPPPYTASYPLVRWHFSFIPLFSCPRSTKAARVLRSLVLGTRTVSKLPRKSSVKSIKPALQLDHVSIRTTFVLAACKLTYVSVSGSILSSRGSPRVTLQKGRKRKKETFFRMFVGQFERYAVDFTRYLILRKWRSLFRRAKPKETTELKN